MQQKCCMENWAEFQDLMKYALILQHYQSRHIFPVTESTDAFGPAQITSSN